MRRSPGRPQTLKHLAFFEVLAEAAEDSREAKLATAGLLSLRMIDHWVLAGPAIVEPESVSVRSVRLAIMALPSNEPVREALLSVVNTMQMLRHVVLVPVLPRVFAYAQLLERHHGAMKLAADAYETVVRLADLEFDADLIMDSYLNLAICQRKTGSLESAVESSTALIGLAKRRKDRPRTLRARISLAHVAMMRGDLAGADAEFLAIATEAQKHNMTREYAMSTHNRAVVASRKQQPGRAVVLAYAALKNTSDPVDRDRVLGDLAAFLIPLGRYDAALDALRVLEVTASSEEPRVFARINMVVIAALTNSREVFEAASAALDGADIAVEARVGLLVETARCRLLFNEPAAAADALTAAERICVQHDLTALMREVDRLRTGSGAVTHTISEIPVADENPVHEVELDLRQMAASMAG